MKKNKIKNPSIQSFDKFKKETSNKKNNLENMENMETFMKMYSSKNKLSIHQFKQILKK